MSDSEEFEIEEFDQQDDCLGEQDLPSVRKYLQNPKQLMQKILFTSFKVNPFFPIDFIPIPEMVKPDTAQKDSNNMNLIQQSTFNHQKLRNDVLGFLLSNHLTNKQTLKRILPTMTEFYEGKAPIYQKYQSNPKAKCMATYLLDAKSVLKQQLKKNQAGIFSQNKGVPILATHRTKIQFNSNFESGNLFRAYQVEYNQFDLVLQNDINSKGNCQWFFFLVKNVPKGLTLKFNIVNLSKKHSLFDSGMKPYIFSMTRYEKRKVGWTREGLKIQYKENERFKKQDSEKPYYTLSFEYRFAFEGDVVYFSHSLPYRVADLAHFISEHIKQPSNSKLIKFKDLNKTLGGQQLNVIQISEHQWKQHKKIVWIIARQHPGQVTSSFMIQGIINFLLSKTPKVRQLLKKYIFKIVPMLNIDGVVHGNSRAQLNGADPNRKWANPHKIRNPIIWSLKKIIQKDKGKVEMFLDLHSHSRKLNTFFYGNSFRDNKLSTRKYPWMVSKNDERFNYSSCRFSQCNFTSARHVFFEMLQIPLVYTVESSLYGYQKNDHRIIEYLPKDYRQMGITLIQSFWEYCLENENSNMIYSLQNKRQIQEIINNQQDEKQSIGSDSDPGQDQFQQSQLKKLIPNFFGQKKIKNKKVVKKKQNKDKTKKNIKQQTPPPLGKIKKCQKQSHYKIYFSGRSTNLDRKFTVKGKQMLETKQIGVQAQISQCNILKGATNLSATTLLERRSSLFICGQKVQEQYTIFGNCVAIQADMLKIFSQSRQQIRKGSAPRKSFKVSSRINSVLQVKENNFLNRGDFHTLPLRSNSKR